MRNFILKILLVLIFLMPCFANAQGTIQQEQDVWRAKALEIVNTKTEKVPGTNVETKIQTIRAKLLEGARKGEIIKFKNDYIQLEEGQKFT